MIDLSIVVPSYQNAACLSDCLAALRVAREAHPELAFEVIVVDNGSLDESRARVLASELQPRLVAWVRNRGFAAAANAGLRRRRGRHALLLNSDVRVDAELLAGGVAILDAQPEIGVLGAALFHPDGRAQRSVHAWPGLWTELVPGLERRRAGGAPDAAGLRDVEAVRGAVFFIRGEALEKVGLLDEGYFFFLEETDYCARVRAAGLRVVFAEGLRAEHRLGASSKRRAPLATRIEFHRSLYRFIERREGRLRAALVRGLRLARNLLVVGVLALASVVSRGARPRLSERAGLVLWHLRGRPPEPGLAEALARASRRPSAGDPR